MLVAFIAAILIVPALIDWNGYRGEIIAKAAQVLGRPVEIRGDIGVALLPLPKVSLARAHLGNVEGASEDDMLSLDALEIQLAWAPLLIGNVRVESVKLVRPVFNIEIFDTGESNLTLTPRGVDAAKPTQNPGQSSVAAPSMPVAGLRVTPKIGGGFDISVENFVVENGTVVYRNAVRGLVERVDDLNGRVAFASLKGPMDVSLRATVHGLPVSIEVAAGEIIQGRTAPFSLDATIAPGAVKVQFSGSLNGLDDALRLRGRLTAEGQNLTDLARALGVRDAPAALGRSFGLQTNMTLAADGAELADLTIKLDGAQANGRLAATFTDKTTIDAALTATRLDLDALLRTQPPAKPDTRAKALTPTPSPTPNATSTSLDLPFAGQRQGQYLALETLPANLTANLTIGVDAITWRGAAVRQSKLDLSLANREITVSQLSALLPGNSDVAVFGFVTEKDDLPQFDGTVEMTSSDVRAALDWLGLSTKGIAGDRLRNASLNARLSARPDVASASELRARFDATQIDGALTANIAAYPSFGANLTIDRINLDAYMPVADDTPAPAAKPAASPSASNKAPNQTTALPDLPSSGPFAALSALNGFNANLRARVGSAMFKGLPLNDVRIEATLADGTLDVKSASIGDLVGVTASVSGVIGGLDSTDPTARDLVFDAKGKSLANLFRMAEIKSPVSAEALGPVAAKVRLNGSLKTLDVVSEIQAMGGRSALNGRIDMREIAPRFDARVELGYPDAARFVRGLGIDWRPRGAKGGIDLAANLSGNPFEMGLHELAGSIAGVRVTGAAAARLPLLGRKTLVAMNLKTSDLDLDSFLPAKRTAALDQAPSDRDATVQKASFRAPTLPARGVVLAAAAPNGARDGAWSSEPLDLSALTAFDGSFTVRSDSLRLGGLTIVNADLDAELQNGLLEIRHLTGKTFGGALTLDGGLMAEATGGRFEARYALADADVGAADRAYGAKEASRGNATLEGRLRGGGKSTAELVSSLSGDGSLAFKGIDSADGQGSILAAVGGIAQSLERLGGYRGRLEPVSINLSGPYRVENGIVNFDDFAFTSPIGDGGLKGRADLPKWQIAALGEIRLAKDFVIGGGTSKPVPFALDGALDAPRLKLDIAALPGGGIQIPLDKLKTKKGATEVLKSFIPNRAPKRESPTVESLPPPGAAPVAPAPPEANAKTDLKADPKAAPKTDFKVAPKAELQKDTKAETPGAKKGERVEDILKDILRGVSR